MLSTAQLHVKGRHHTLLPATTIEARPGELLLVQADGQDQRTALALTLTGRMKPSSGTVTLDGSAGIKTLRTLSTIVDSPDVSAPERHLTVRGLVAEDLALVPRKLRGRARPTAWLAARGHTDIAHKWVEELDTAQLLFLQLELALANPKAQLVVVDSPDRHSAEPETWLPLLRALAAGTLGNNGESEAQELTVIAVVGRVPDGWDGAVAQAGNDTAAEEEPEKQKTGKDDAGPAALAVGVPAAADAALPDTAAPETAVPAATGPDEAAEEPVTESLPRSEPAAWQPEPADAVELLDATEFIDVDSQTTDPMTVTADPATDVQEH